MRLEILYHCNITPLILNEQGDWIDLRSAGRVELQAGEHKLINLGISIRLPQGYEAHIVPRSSTFKHWGLLQTNAPGIIDESYCGKDDVWFFSAYATRNTVIEKNDRVCQFRVFEKMPRPQLVSITELNTDNRGGYGSSGRN